MKTVPRVKKKKFTNTYLVCYTFLHTGSECDLLDGSYTKLAVVDVKMHVDFPVFFLNSLHFPAAAFPLSLSLSLPSTPPLLLSSLPLAIGARLYLEINVTYFCTRIYRQSAFTCGGRIHHTTRHWIWIRVFALTHSSSRWKKPFRFFLIKNNTVFFFPLPLQGNGFFFLFPFFFFPPPPSCTVISLPSI